MAEQLLSPRRQRFLRPSVLLAARLPRDPGVCVKGPLVEWRQEHAVAGLLASPDGGGWATSLSLGEGC